MTVGFVSPKRAARSPSCGGASQRDASAGAFRGRRGLRCVSKHGRARTGSSSSFETRTHVRVCGTAPARAPQDEDGRARAELRLVAEPLAVVLISRCQTAHLVPAAHFCVRALHRCFTHPESRGGRSAEKRSGARRNTREACT